MVAHLGVLTLTTGFGPRVAGFPDVANPYALLGPVASGIQLAAIVAYGPITLLASIALVRRLRRAADPDRLRALRLAATAAWIYTGSWWCCTALAVFGALPGWLGPVADQLGLVFPAMAWIGIVRHRLLDARLAASRTLAYLVLSLIVLAIYLAAVAVAGFVASGWVSSSLAVVAAALAAVPLREVVQRRVNVMLYGAASDPALALHRLGERLRDAVTADQALTAAVRTVVDVLRLRHAAVDVDGERVAAHGEPGPGDATERVALPFAGEVIGHLLLEPRIDRPERALLDRMAPQLALTVHAALLTRALRTARDRQIAARDEERLRMRRDLHDGLGPTLAGMVLSIEHVSRRLASDPEGARAALAQLHGTTQQAVVDVRQIVHALRPPVLETLGLAGAVAEHARRLGAASVRADDDLPPLPATVELGTYLIALEAMNNAARHAHRGTFTVRVSAGDVLTVEVVDDGPGLPDGYRPGIGIQSMRDRAAELGGTLRISPGTPAGTRVHLQIPLPA